MMRCLQYVFVLVIVASQLGAQSGLSLQGARHDNTLPIDVTAQTLTIDQATQIAIFEGDARAVQGEITIDAQVIRVAYIEETGEIAQVIAEGEVVYSNGAETANAERAEFTNATNLLILEGAVTLNQGQTQISADQMRLNVSTNAAEMVGNVRTRFVPRN